MRDHAGHRRLWRSRWERTGALMGVIAGAMSFVSLFCRPYRGQSVGFGQQERCWWLRERCCTSLAGCHVLSSPIRRACWSRRAWSTALGFACGTVCLATWVSLLLPIRHMGAGMGLYGIVNALAIAVGPALGIRLQAAVGYQWTFIASLTLNVCAFVTVLLVKNGGRPARKTVAAEQSLRHRLRLRNLVEPRAIPLAAVFMMFAIPYFANQSFLVDYMFRHDICRYLVRLVLRVLRGRAAGTAAHACATCSIRRVSVSGLSVCSFAHVGVACLSHVHDERLVCCLARASPWRPVMD